MAHKRRDNFLNYHWVEMFYDKVVQKYGQEATDALILEAETAHEESFQARRKDMLDKGFEEVGIGMYVFRGQKGTPDPEKEMYWKKKFQEAMNKAEGRTEK